MFEQLQVIAKRYEELQELVARPEVMADTARYKTILRELGSLQKTVDTFRRYQDLERRRREAQELIEQGGDREIAELAHEELKELKATEAALIEELKRILVVEDADAQRNVIIEIRAGTGGEEACLFAADLFRMYMRYAESRGWSSEVLSRHATELGGLKEVIVLVRGGGAYDKLRFESGGHRVQRIPVTESQGRIQTSAATVAVLPEVEEIELDISPADLKIDTFRAGGPGGQNVNKTSSAVRITHLPSALVVQCQDESSQHKNKSKAMKILASRLYDLEASRRRRERDESRRSQIGSGDRSERIRTYHWGRAQVTDHRLKSSFLLERILDGDLDEMLGQLKELDIQEKLRNLS
ncbi:MAG: peptide chain release factor 1 [Planctomycetota bacterium]